VPIYNINITREPFITAAAAAAAAAASTAAGTRHCVCTVGPRREVRENGFWALYGETSGARIHTTTMVLHARCGGT